MEPDPFLRGKHGRSAKDISKELARTLSPIETIKELRNHFPELTLAQAKEVLIVTTTEYKSLEDYQADLLKVIEKYDLEDKPAEHKKEEL